MYSTGFVSRKQKAIKEMWLKNAVNNLYYENKSEQS